MSSYDKIDNEADFDAFIARRKVEKTKAEIKLKSLQAQKTAAGNKWNAKDQERLDMAEFERDAADLDLSEEGPRRTKLQAKLKADADAAQKVKDEADAKTKTADYEKSYREAYERLTGTLHRPQTASGNPQLAAESDPYSRLVLEYLGKDMGGKGERQKTGKLMRTFETANPLFLSSIFGRSADEIQAELQAEDIAKRGGGKITKPGAAGAMAPLDVIKAIQSGDPARIAAVGTALGVAPQDFASHSAAGNIPASDLANADIDVPRQAGNNAQAEVSSELARNPSMGSKRLAARYIIPTITSLAGGGKVVYDKVQGAKDKATAEKDRSFLPEDRDWIMKNAEPIRITALEKANEGKAKEKMKANQALADAFKTITGATYDSYGSLSPSFIQEQFFKQKQGIWHEGFSNQEDIRNLALAAYQKGARGENNADDLGALKAAYNRATVKNKGPTYIGGVPEEIGDMSYPGIAQAGIFTMIQGKDGPTLVVIPRTERGYGSPIDVGAKPEEPTPDLASLGSDWDEAAYLGLPGAREALKSAIEKRDMDRRARGESSGTYRPRL